MRLREAAYEEERCFRLAIFLFREGPEHVLDAIVASGCLF